MRKSENSAYLRQIRHELCENIKRSYRALCHWKRLRRSWGKNTTAIVLIPCGDHEISFYALAHLKQMLSCRQLQNAIILSNDMLVLKICKTYSRSVADSISITNEEMEDYLHLYNLYRFDDSFIVASLELPHGRNGTSLIGVKGITKEEVFCIGVYGLSECVRAGCEYQGEDTEVAEFLRDMRERA